jgi:6-pyruvoyltetrahydropterin/6-carboxytetrahydropterin synthase
MYYLNRDVMITITKIVRFEAAHAIFGYTGACAHIHGHSYELHVTIAAQDQPPSFFSGTGIMVDFKDLKAWLQEIVIKIFDHKLILSKNYLNAMPGMLKNQELVIFEAEPTAENLLIYIQQEITKKIPANLSLISLRLWETRDSYADWLA